MNRACSTFIVRSAAVVIAAVFALGSLGGCAVLGFGGALVETYKRGSTHAIEAEYTGLTGKSFAVVVVADRYIQGESPALVYELTRRISERLREHTQATGYIPADRLLQYLYNHPRWTAMSRAELAKELGVSRLVVVEMLAYQLTDPGDQYIWNGSAAGTIGVIEADAAYPEELAFQKPVRVQFPDKPIFGPQQMPAAAVATKLVERFVDRATWLFYTHQEPYYPEY